MSHGGGCECGAVRYRMTTDPILVNCCHCLDCQRITGSAFALNAMIETVRVELLRGRAVEHSLQRAGETTRAWRCGQCLTLLWSDHPKLGDGMRFVRVGTLEAASALAPDAHFFVRSKHPWVVLPDGIPAYETLPPHGMGVDLPPDRKARLLV